MFRPAFAIVSHRSSQTVKRLVGRLNLMFGDPVIVVHHDQAKSKLEQSDVPGNVVVMQNWRSIDWAGPQLTPAIIETFRAVVGHPRPTDWVTLLSEHCYPIKSADYIARELSASPFDGYIDARPIQIRHTGDPWHDQRVERYQQFMVTPTRVDQSTRKDIPGKRLSVRMSRLLLPFFWGIRCYSGSTWMTLRTSTAAKLVQRFDKSRYLDWHFRRCVLSDESQPQTLLMNMGLNISHESDLRYIDWSAGGNSPKTLGMADVPKLQAAPDHFARKFDLFSPDSRMALDAIDAFIG